MKEKILLILMIIMCNVCIGQVVKYKTVHNEDLIYVLNNMEKMTHYEFHSGDVELFINVYNVSDQSGSAGFDESDEITNSIYIAVSEDGEAPEQYLFKLTSLYDPKFIKWEKTPTGSKLIITYGIVNKRKKTTIRITLKQLFIQ